MADIFISYRHGDRQRVEPIVRALREEGFDVWWDKGIAAGTHWRRELHSQLEQAKVIAPIWTSASVASDWVIEEAAYGKQHGRLCPARIDPVDPPIGFTTIQVADLSTWRGNRRAEAWGQFVHALRALIDGVSSESFEPPARHWNRRRLAVAGSIAAILTCLTWSVPVMTGLPLHHTFRGTAEQREQWIKAKSGGDCAAIRAFLSAGKDSPFAADAKAALARVKKMSVPGWAAKQHVLPVTGISSDDSGRAAACRSAVAAAKRSGGESCGLFFNSATAPRRMVVTVIDEACSCREALGHWQCVIDTRAQCSWEVREPVTKETCL